MSSTDTEKSSTSPVARVAAIAAIAIVVVVLAFVLLRGGGGDSYTLRFQNAGQLVKGDDVQIGGRRVGSIQEITLTGNNEAAVKVQMEKEFSPLHEGTTAVVRATSLSGIANRYIALTLGHNSNKALRSGTVIGADKTTAPVDLDQIFNTLDPRTRHSLQQVVQGSAAQYQGKGAQANAAARYFNPALSTTSALVREALTDQKSFTDFIVNSSKLVTTIAQRRDDLSALVANANATAGAIASENVALARALDLLPTTLRRANTTFVNLRFTLNDLDVLVNASKPATKRLAPFLHELRPLVAAARPTIHDLRTLVRKPGPNNDLTDATRKFPALQRVASPSFQAGVAALKRSQNTLEFIRPYAPELTGWLRDFGLGAAAYDANGHYARISPIFGAFQANVSPANVLSLTPQPVTDRFRNFKTGVIKRCPGAATQPAVDGSSPYRDASGNLDCDPSLTP